MAPLRATEAKARLHAGGEVACLDVREQGPYGEGHPFLAVPCPYSRLETRVVSLVPRLGVPILLIDDGDGLAEHAAAKLRGLGYREVDWIEGGAPAWSDAGYTLFKGVNVPSKTLGELVEEQWHVPRIGPDMLAEWFRQGRALQLFDGRPASEYAKMTIPGSRCAPNGELAHRWEAAIAGSAGPVVVNCAGRTRSIIGAAGLMLAGASDVYALENGTQGWALSGRTLQHGAQAEPLPAADRDASRRRARAIAEARNIDWIDHDGAQTLARDTSRTTYLFDVRDAADRAADPHPAAAWAPGGQLVQATDQWIGVRRARVILADDTGLRATLAAFWLRQLRYEVFVLPGVGSWPVDWRLNPSDLPRTPKLADVPSITVGEAVERARTGAALIDLRPSMSYRAAHLPGARWSTRSRLPRLSAGCAALLVGDPDAVALVGLDLSEAGVAEIRRVEGDESAWQSNGVSLVATPDDPSDAEAIDYLFFVHDRHDGNLDAARNYLAWETGLTAQLDLSEAGEYRLDPLRP
jgi:rhodanese-related sulfurtransferase